LVLKEIQVLWDLRVPLAHKVHKVHKAHKEMWDHRGLKVPKVLKVL
jgi:hypothetical protein